MQKFKVIIEITNNELSSKNIEIFEVIPLYYNILIHTYKYQINESKVFHIFDLDSFHIQKGLKDEFTYLSWNISLPKQSKIRIEYSCIKLLMHREFYPPDTSRGIEVLATIIRDKTTNKMYTTETNTILLPFPDATMPFNVITLVSFLR